MKIVWRASIQCLDFVTSLPGVSTVVAVIYIVLCRMGLSLPASANTGWLESILDPIPSWSQSIHLQCPHCHLTPLCPIFPSPIATLLHFHCLCCPATPCHLPSIIGSIHAMDGTAWLQPSCWCCSSMRPHKLPECLLQLVLSILWQPAPAEEEHHHYLAQVELSHHCIRDSGQCIIREGENYMGPNAPSNLAQTCKKPSWWLLGPDTFPLWHRHAYLLVMRHCRML